MSTYLGTTGTEGTSSHGTHSWSASVDKNFNVVRFKKENQKARKPSVPSSASCNRRPPRLLECWAWAHRDTVLLTTVQPHEVRPVQRWGTSWGETDRLTVGVIGMIHVWPGRPLLAGLYFVDWLMLGSTNQDLPTHQKCRIRFGSLPSPQATARRQNTLRPTTS